jgi:hypothetical protein
MIEPLDCFFNDFALAVTLPSTAVIRGILENTSAQDLGMLHTDPVLTAKSSDLAGLTTGQTVDVGGTNYLVRIIEPDNTGITRLTLEKA